MSQPEPILVSSIGPYEVIAPLSEGGVAQIFLVRRERQLCVLKRLRLAMLQNPMAAKRLVREAQVTSLLRHPNIAQTIDAGFEGETFYIVMELIRGKELSELFAALSRDGRKLPIELAVGMICEVLEAIEYAHALRGPEGAEQVVHRDLSMRNIMVTYDGELKVIDFGVAKASSKDTLTASGVLLGTPKYMSPEQAVAERVDHRTDIYTLAVVLYELLSGKTVVSAAKPLDALRQVVSETPPALHILDPQIPRALSEAVAKGMEKERKDRWSSAERFKNALVAALGRLRPVKAPLAQMMRALFEADRAAQNAMLAEHEAELEISEPTISASSFEDLVSGDGVAVMAVQPPPGNRPEPRAERHVATEVVRVSPPSVARAPSPKKPPRIAVFVALALLGTGALSVGARAFFSRTEVPEVTVIPPALPERITAPRAIAARPVVQPAAVPKPKTAVKVLRTRDRSSHVKKVRPPRARSAHPAIDAQMRRLLEDPNNSRLKALLDDIDQAAQKVSGPKRAPLRAAIAVAKLHMQIETVRKAYEALQAATAAP